MIEIFVEEEEMVTGWGGWCWFGMSYILIDILLVLGDSSKAV